MGVFAAALSLFLSPQGDPGHDGAPGAVGEKVSEGWSMHSRGVSSCKSTLGRDQALGKIGCWAWGEDLGAVGLWGKSLCH